MTAREVQVRLCMPEPDPVAYEAMKVLVEKLWMRAFGGSRYKIVIYTDANASDITTTRPDLFASIVLLVSAHTCGSVCVTGMLAEASSSNSEHLSAQRSVSSSALFLSGLFSIAGLHARPQRNVFDGHLVCGAERLRFIRRKVHQ